MKEVVILINTEYLDILKTIVDNDYFLVEIKFEEDFNASLTKVILLYKQIDRLFEFAEKFGGKCVLKELK